MLKVVTGSSINLHVGLRYCSEELELKFSTILDILVGMGHHLILSEVYVPSLNGPGMAGNIVPNTPCICSSQDTTVFPSALFYPIFSKVIFCGGLRAVIPS